MKAVSRYAVLLPGGDLHPPADLETLNAWAGEGRIVRETLLVPEGSSATIAAGTVPGLVFPAGTVPRTQREAGMSAELRSAWICAGLALLGGLVPCVGRISGAAALVGLLLAFGLRKRGEPGAGLALAANAVGLGLAVVWLLIARRFGF